MQSTAPVIPNTPFSTIWHQREAALKADPFNNNEELLALLRKNFELLASLPEVKTPPLCFRNDGAIEEEKSTLGRKIRDLTAIRILSPVLPQCVAPDVSNDLNNLEVFANCALAFFKVYFLDKATRPAWVNLTYTYRGLVPDAINRITKLSERYKSQPEKYALLIRVHGIFSQIRDSIILDGTHSLKAKLLENVTLAVQYHNDNAVEQLRFIAGQINGRTSELDDVDFQELKLLDEQSPYMKQYRPFFFAEYASRYWPGDNGEHEQAIREKFQLLTATLSDLREKATTPDEKTKFEKFELSKFFKTTIGYLNALPPEPSAPPMEDSSEEENHPAWKIGAWLIAGVISIPVAGPATVLPYCLSQAYEGVKDWMCKLPDEEEPRSIQQELKFLSGMIERSPKKARKFLKQYLKSLPPDPQKRDLKPKEAFSRLKNHLSQWSTSHQPQLV